jgi:hypothetical protein
MFMWEIVGMVTYFATWIYRRLGRTTGGRSELVT